MRARSSARRSRLALALVVLATGAVVSCADGADGTVPPPRTETRGRSGDGAAALPRVILTPAFPGVSFLRPVQVTHAGDGTGRMFVVEQKGRIQLLRTVEGTATKSSFLDIASRVRARHNEEGLLTLAFHPAFRENGTFFVYYTASGPRRGVLARYRVSTDDPDRADPRSGQVVLEVEQPFGNHNGATVLFGPDGFLYLSLGDGGSAGDPHGHGQDLGTLLGAILRIDVDRTQDDRPYAIPPDNPFVDHEGARPEIWAYGLRNVWRMSFDSETGDLWAGDVGQNRWEEVNLVVRGGNYGWNVREGRHAFRAREVETPLVDPVAEYGRRDGISITGGLVYRGSRNPGLRGAYLYADYGSGSIWALRLEDGRVVAQRRINGADDRVHVTSFGEDESGEAYLCVFDRADGRRGRVLKMIEQ